MAMRLLPLIVAPAILLPLALYAFRQRRVRGALWYAVLLVALAVWCAAYAWELSAVGVAEKTLALKVKYPRGADDAGGVGGVHPRLRRP